MNSSQLEDIVQILEPLKRKIARSSAGSNNQLGIRELLARFREHFLGKEIDLSDFVCDGVDAGGIVPFLISQLNFLWVVDKSLRQLRSIDWKITLRADNGNSALETLLSETFNATNGCGSTTDDND